jgi:hypothetical protein
MTDLDLRVIPQVLPGEGSVGARCGGRRVCTSAMSRALPAAVESGCLNRARDQAARS